MAWLDRINERETRRLAKGLQHTALQTRDMAQDQFNQFAHQARGAASHAAHQLADYGRHEGADFARDALQHYAHRAGELSHHLADYGRQEGALLAHEAARQARRAGRAVKADPVPVIVGALGIALLANLLLSRRPRRSH